MNKLAWTMMLVLLAVIAVTLFLGYGGILMTVMGPQVVAISAAVCAYALMSSAGVVD